MQSILVGMAAVVRNAVLFYGLWAFVTMLLLLHMKRVYRLLQILVYPFYIMKQNCLRKDARTFKSFIGKVDEDYERLPNKDTASSDKKKKKKNKNEPETKENTVTNETATTNPVNKPHSTGLTNNQFNNEDDDTGDSDIVLNIEDMKSESSSEVDTLSQHSRLSRRGSRRSMASSVGHHSTQPLVPSEHGTAPWSYNKVRNWFTGTTVAHQDMTMRQLEDQERARRRRSRERRLRAENRTQKCNEKIRQSNKAYRKKVRQEESAKAQARLQEELRARTATGATTRNDGDLTVMSAEQPGSHPLDVNAQVRQGTADRRQSGSSASTNSKKARFI